ncbi:VWA domain-containing protein [Sphaerotilus sp.]|uniref:VWA domain-containing protein n=1 Tax=Sphaerotilus sp. TaxID=2093942 RepID=UPI002ACDCE9C|nr:VWA domain-containing protein [Sphaerotilus sp.]MDZ7857375.1 VWA domain-containing protein [Sphaerotilus sp.]
MFNPLSLASALLSKLAFKPIKYFIDSTFRDKVTPVPGSVVYCDLWLAVEHSGIHVQDGKMSNIVVDGFAESTVCLSDAWDFTTKSKWGRKIYVSCDRDGPVGHDTVAERAASHLGERAFYGLVVKNCHEFSTKCVNHLDHTQQEEDDDRSLLDSVLPLFPDDTWEPTMAILKASAKRKLGATKWRLWDWENDEARATDDKEDPEPDWNALDQQFRRLPLTPGNLAHLRQQLAEAQAYEAEIDDENLPPVIRQRLRTYRQTLTDISDLAEKAKALLAACPDAGFSYEDLRTGAEDFTALAQQIRQNPQIRELVRKLGRQHIAEEIKRQTRIPQASRSEVHGTHRSNDLMRLLPSELLNFEDETLETLFYARLLENNLLTYELSGSTLINGETTESRQQRTGPVVACLDTSGSMQGEPLLKAKALLLAVAGILKPENRSLHVILFGASGQTRTFTMDGTTDHHDAAGLLAFLRQGFGGGTDFETPLQHAMDLIEQQPAYLKADVLMLSDGDCQPSDAFTTTLHARKARLNARIYSVLCNGQRVQDRFSDEVVLL